MSYITKSLYAFAFLGTILLCRPAFSAELQSIQWQSGAPTETLSLNLDEPTPHRVESLDNGQRLRVVLPNATLAEGISNLPGTGVVKSVFPFVDESGEGVNVDLLLTEPGQLNVTETAEGLAIVATAGASGGDTMDQSADSSQGDQGSAMAASPGGEANVLEDIKFATLPGGRVQVNLTMSRPPERPGHFSTNNPPRLAFDFFNTRSGLDSPVTRVGVGAVESINAVQADDRMRLVFNLVRNVPYESQITDEGMVFVIQNPDTASAQVEQLKPKPFAKKSAAKHSIRNIDFRRSSEGGGRITVQLSSPEIGVDVQDQSGDIIIDFLNTEIDDELEQRLDVVDFATPVQTIDTFQEGNTVRMVVTPAGNYQHLAYQAGEVFNINVDPIVELEEEEREVDEFGFSGERLSLNFQQINVRAALQVIADFTGLNFVTSDSVGGTLTLRLKDVPWDQALDIILQTRGLGMRRSGNVVWVAPAEEIASRERQQLESQKEQNELQPLTSELIQINYAKATDIADILKSVKAIETGTQQSIFGSVTVSEIETESNSLLTERGNVTVDERTNSILIQDTPGKIAQVRQLIAQLDKPVRQVLIETRIVEANDDFSRSLGARLGFQRVVQQSTVLDGADVVGSGRLEGAAATSSSLTGGVGAPSFGGIPDGLSVNLPSVGAGGNPAASYAFEIFKAGTGIANLIQLEISALEAEGRGKIIANPRLITSNQREAYIEQGQERPSIGLTGQNDAIKAVLSLTVTPQITPDDRVVLDVQVTQDSFVNPIDDTINTKRIETQVLLENGETAVIGGIYQQNKSTDVAKVPLLGDIPALGALFRTKTRRDERTELLIFLTPRIVNPALNIGSLGTAPDPAA